MMQNSGMNTCWLIGHPVAHSLSPGMQRVLYRDMGIEGWAYRKKDLKEIYQIKEFISGVIKKKDIGFNVTVPHKENIIKLIDKTDEAALAIGAVNTVKNSRGILKGYNTDWVGFKNDLKESIGIKKCRDALVLGAGGAGRSVVYALAGGIADGDIYLYDKDIARAGRLKKDLSNNNAVSVVGSLSAALDMPLPRE
jgi:shikimate dehydrogenase